MQHFRGGEEVHTVNRFVEIHTVPKTGWLLHLSGSFQESRGFACAHLSSFTEYLCQPKQDCQGLRFPYCLPIKRTFSESLHFNFGWQQFTNLYQKRKSCCFAVTDSLSRRAIHWFLQEFGFKVEQVCGIWLLSDHISWPPQVAAERFCLRLQLGLVGCLPRAGAWYISVVYMAVCFHRYNIHIYCFGD